MTLAKGCPRPYSIAPRCETPAAAAAKVLPLQVRSAAFDRVLMRRTYHRAPLLGDGLPPDPYLRFRILFNLCKLLLIITFESSLTLIKWAHP